MILAKIQAKKNFMSRTERKIAEVILDNPEKFIKYSAIELSAIAGVSQGSINNFSKKFASGGYAALKVKVATELKAYVESNSDSQIEDDSISGIMKSSAKNIYTAFLQTQQLNNEKALMNVAQLIMTAKKIEIYGVAQSGVVAEDFAHQLSRLGYVVKSVTKALICQVSAMALDSDSLVIAISMTGCTSDVYDGVRIAKENGAKCICITRNDKSPVAKLCDEVLLVSQGSEEILNFADGVKMCEYYLISAICTYIRYHMTDAEKLRYTKIINILNTHMMDE